MYERSPGALSPGYRHCLEASPGDVINPGSTIEAKQARPLGKRTFRPPLPTPPPRGCWTSQSLSPPYRILRVLLKKIIRRLGIITEWDCNYGMGEPGPREGRGAGVGELRIASGAGTENKLFPAKRRWGG